MTHAELLSRLARVGGKSPAAEAVENVYMNFWEGWFCFFSEFILMEIPLTTLTRVITFTVVGLFT